LDAAGIIGSVSAIFWALMLIVTFKYVVLILRADNRGEGGSLALTAMAALTAKGNSKLHGALLTIGVFGATLFYGDSIITPAISVLGAVEGLEVVTPAFKSFVVPITLGVLLGLFLIQRHGTGLVGRLFGPVLMVWFATLALVGVFHIAQEPAILVALNPLYALHFLMDRGWEVFAALGAIVLALTGAEALYADMGHFGRKPIQLAWLGLVMPALALNYMGQGALLMRDPSAIENPFFRLFPADWVMPMVVLATMAAIIASQAVISGAFSMTKQAIHLGYLPRMLVRYTSSKEAGQIYLPGVNWALLVGVAVAVVGFGSSSALAGAYGIAVTITMLITTFMTFFVVRRSWHLPAVVAWGSTLFFMTLDIAFVSGCAIKFFDGGWFPLAMGVGLFVLMSTWSRGRQLVMESVASDGLELKPFIDSLPVESMYQVPRTAVYAVANPKTVPQALLHNLKHNNVLHACNVILTVVFHEVPWIHESERIELKALGPNFWGVKAHFGFMDTPDVPQALTLCEAKGLPIPKFETSYFLSRETVVPTPGAGMADWREHLFATMNRNASGVVEFFRLPDNAVVELGTRVQI
jgi:KUP system potassium uptake protein